MAQGSRQQDLFSDIILDCLKLRIEFLVGEHVKQYLSPALPILKIRRLRAVLENICMMHHGGVNLQLPKIARTLLSLGD
jgi:hypothetical protein